MMSEERSDESGSAPVDDGGTTGEVAKATWGGIGKWKTIAAIVGFGGLGAATVVPSVVTLAKSDKPKTEQVSAAPPSISDETSGGSSAADARGKKGAKSQNQPPLASQSQLRGMVAGSAGDNSLENRIGAQEANISTLNYNLNALQTDQAAAFELIARKLNELEDKVGKAPTVSDVPRVDLPPLLRDSRPNERFQGEYQTKVSHFKANQGNFWALPEGKIDEIKKTAFALRQPEVVRVSLSESSDKSATVPVAGQTFEYIIPAGSRITAITEQVVSSDHPGFFTSRVVRPEIIRGAQLICQQGGQQNDRIPVQVVKVIFKGQEYQLSGQVEVGFPGVTGKVNRHYGSRAVPIIANAAITGGFVAWSAQNRGGDRIDTRDAITAEVINQTLPQVQNEIASFGVARPHTVTVNSGTQFNILLTDRLIVGY
jgi:hypothetical protein